MRQELRQNTAETYSLFASPCQGAQVGDLKTRGWDVGLELSRGLVEPGSFSHDGHVSGAVGRKPQFLSRGFSAGCPSIRAPGIFNSFTGYQGDETQHFLMSANLSLFS